MPDSREPPSAPRPEVEATELDRRLFHLKTLYDVSQVMLGVTDTRTLLKNFLFMTLGNFGVVEGFVYLRDEEDENGPYLEAAGIGDRRRWALQEAVEKGIDNPGPEFPFTVACTSPITVQDGIGGLLGLGPKLTETPYSDDDRELLETLVNNLTISLRNARTARALEKAYAEVSALNRAKDRAIDHLSHELKTPLTVLKVSLSMLRKQFAKMPDTDTAWEGALARADRNLARLFELEDEVEDIMKDRAASHYLTVTHLFEQCAEDIEALLAEAAGEVPAVEALRRRIDKVYRPRMVEAEDIWMDHFVGECIEKTRPLFDHRRLDVRLHTEKVPPISMPPGPLDTVVKGLVRNAVENTPEEGMIEVAVRATADRVLLVVHDYGTGIPEAHHQRIFEGFVPVQETLAYSSGRPFDFNAGGKGADLLRIKIFSERYGFEMKMSSERCRHIPQPADTCCGDASICRFCGTAADCRESGGTTFTVSFPASG